MLLLLHMHVITVAYPTHVIIVAYPHPHQGVTRVIIVAYPHPLFCRIYLSFGLHILLLCALNPCVAAYILLLFLYFLALSSIHPSTF